MTERGLLATGERARNTSWKRARDVTVEEATSDASTMSSRWPRRQAAAVPGQLGRATTTASRGRSVANAVPRSEGTKREADSPRNPWDPTRRDATGSGR
jgi:hypothetical protein